jgi:hypothetical protein
MSHKLGIACLIAVCSCSTNGVDPELPPPPQTGSAEATPDSDALPPVAQLIAEPVDSVADVPGTYVQPFAVAGDISLITIEQPNYGMGSYQAFRSCGLPTCVAETGRYNILATNPAIGFAALSLVDQTGTLRVTYMLDYLWRDQGGELVAIQLRPMVGNAAGPTQVWWRYGAQTPPPSAPAHLALGPDEPLAGVFVRALPIYGDIDAITLDEADWTETTATGTYDAAYPYCLPWCFGEAGDYRFDVASLATGTGHLSLIPAGNPEAAHDYAVYAIWRTPDGAPAAIQLQRIDGVVASGPPFTLYRQWWTP